MGLRKEKSGHLRRGEDNPETISSGADVLKLGKMVNVGAGCNVCFSWKKTELSSVVSASFSEWFRVQDKHRRGILKYEFQRFRFCFLRTAGSFYNYYSFVAAGLA